MTEFKSEFSEKNYEKVFLDTTPLIYFLDDDVNFGQTCKNIFEEILGNEKQIVTSVITVTEYLVYPYRTGNQEKMVAMHEFMYNCGINAVSINFAIADQAARIRADYKAFKAMDSLQLAAACYSGCDLFLTNDKQLKQFKEIKCVTVDEWDKI